MATFKFLFNGQDVSNSNTSDQKLNSKIAKLKELILTNDHFNSFSGEFNFQFNGIIFYTYLSEVSIELEKLIIPRQLIDGILKELD